MPGAAGMGAGTSRLVAVRSEKPAAPNFHSGCDVDCSLSDAESEETSGWMTSTSALAWAARVRAWACRFLRGRSVDRMQLPAPCAWMVKSWEAGGLPSSSNVGGGIWRIAVDVVRE